jgi:SAM-dependent methyltransferase
MSLAISCPVCGSRFYTTIRKHRSHTVIFKDCFLQRCTDCDMVYAAPMPGEKELEQYNAGYFVNAHGQVNMHPLTVAFLSAINLLRVVHVAAFAEQHHIKIDRVLEIGPGGGEFAKHWLRLHPETLLYAGLESDATRHTNLDAIGVTRIEALEKMPTDTNYDLVVISHVLEHTSNPAAFINACTRKLSAGGILFIEVPCNDHEHKELDEPHLLFFDKHPMRVLLEKLGFGDMKLSYHGNTIEKLRNKRSFLERNSSRVRNLLIRKGLLFPFARRQPGLEKMHDALERAVIKPFNAHKEQDKPSWWLRAVTIKK